VLGLLTKRFRLLFDSPFILKSRPTPLLHRCKVTLATEIQRVTPPFVTTRMSLGHGALFFQPCFPLEGEFWGCRICKLYT